MFKNEEERSIRHARMVFGAVVFGVLLIPIMVGFAALGMWVLHRAVDVDGLIFLIGLMTVAFTFGMYFELRKRW
jgi:hypothetical protein